MKSNTSNEFEWYHPIIIIGAGRSGSTLMSAILGEHHDVYAAGENCFLLNRLWNEFFSKPEFSVKMRIRHLLRNSREEWRDSLWYEFSAGPLRECLQQEHDTMINEIEIREESRVSRSLGKFMAHFLVPPELRRKYWSFKEIWNGSSSFPYGWRCHDQAYPEARYIHIVRHPLSWLKSYFSNRHSQQKKISRDDAIFALSEWVSMIEMSRQQSRYKDRYFEIRYEDLKAEPKTWIGAVLSFLELEDNPRCYHAFKYKYLASNINKVLPIITESDLNRVSGLTKLMKDYKYEPFS